MGASDAAHVILVATAHEPWPGRITRRSPFAFLPDLFREVDQARTRKYSVHSGACPGVARRTPDVRPRGRVDRFHYDSINALGGTT